MTSTPPRMWTSKLGNKYPQEEVEQAHKASMEELTKLRHLGANNCCAECGTHESGNVWSSVNLGVFTCMRCGSLHRALGTHISKPKGCQGSYLWGPDELQRMHDIGNERAATLYGGASYRPNVHASDAVWLEYLKEKYELKKWADKDLSSVLYEPSHHTTNETAAAWSDAHHHQQHHYHHHHYHDTETTTSHENNGNIPLDLASAMDAFANVSAFSSAVTAKPKKNIIHKSPKKPTRAPAAPQSLRNILEQQQQHQQQHPPTLPPPKMDFFGEFGL